MRYLFRRHGFLALAIAAVCMGWTMNLVHGNILLRLPSDGPPPTCDGDLQLSQLSARCTSRQCEELQLFGSLTILQNITEMVQLSLSVSTTLDEEYLHVGTVRLDICEFLEARQSDCPMVGNYRFNFTYPYFLAEYDKFEDGTWNVRLEISSYYDAEQQTSSSSILSYCYMSLVLHKQYTSMSLKKVFVFTSLEVALMIGSIIAGYFARKKCRVACLDELVCLVEDDEEEPETGAVDKPPLSPQKQSRKSSFVLFPQAQQHPAKQQLLEQPPAAEMPLVNPPLPQQQQQELQPVDHQPHNQPVDHQQPRQLPPFDQLLQQQQRRAIRQHRQYASLFTSASGSTASVSSSQQRSTHHSATMQRRESDVASVSSSIQSKPDSTPLLLGTQLLSEVSHARKTPPPSTVVTSSSSSSGIILQATNALLLGLPERPDVTNLPSMTAVDRGSVPSMAPTHAAPPQPLPSPPRHVKPPNYLPPRRASVDPPALKNDFEALSSLLSNGALHDDNNHQQQQQNNKIISHSPTSTVSIKRQDAPVSSPTTNKIARDSHAIQEPLPASPPSNNRATPPPLQ